MLNNRIQQITLILKVMKPIYKKDLDGTIDSDDKMLFITSQNELKSIYDSQPPIVLFPEEESEIQFYINYTLINI